jgi:hypothetical protein
MAVERVPTFPCSFFISPPPQDFPYISDAKVDKSGIDTFNAVLKALTDIGFSTEEQDMLIHILSAILHISNITFSSPVSACANRGDAPPLNLPRAAAFTPLYIHLLNCARVIWRQRSSRQSRAQVFSVWQIC